MGFGVACGLFNPAASRKPIRISADMTLERAGQKLAEVQSRDLGVQAQAKVNDVYALPIEAGTQRWAVSESIYWPKENESSPRMRTKFF